MPRRSKSRVLELWMNGDHVGRWGIDAHGRQTFQYIESWVETHGARPISLSMPLRPADSSYVGDTVDAFFDNLLPDSTEIRRRIQTRFGTRTSAPFDLLTEIGRDCVGAIQLLPPGQAPDGLRKIDGVPLDEKGIAAELRAAVSANALGQQADKPLRISVAGAQEKTALLWHEDVWHRPVGATPSTHLFKLPLGRIGTTQIDMSTSVENEWLCAQIVHAFGIDNASCEMASFEDQRVLIVERFDRRLAQGGKWWLRLPQEDLCQALGVPPGQKYESDGGPGVADINTLLLGSRRSDTDRQTFFRAQVVFWMLCAIDGHAKNFSVFIEASGRYRLTPLYDVLSAYPIIGTGANQYAPQKVTMAMAVSGKNRHYKWAQIMPRHWIATAEKCGLGANVRDVLENLSSQAPKVVSTVESRLPEGFPDDVSIPIFEGLLKAAERLTKFD